MASGLVRRNLVVDWRGEDFTNSPPTISLPDRSGNGNVGVAYNYTRDGITNGSDGNGAIIFVKDTIYDYIANIQVVEVLFKLNQIPSNWASVVTAYDLTGEYQCGIAFFVHSDYRLGIHYYDGATRHFDLFSDVTFSLNRLYHGLLQYNNITGKLEFYLDGVLRKSILVPNLVLKPIKFGIGSWIPHAYQGYNFTGLIYQARAYSSPLTDKEVFQNAMYSLDRYISEYKTIKNSEFIISELMDASFITGDKIFGDFDILEKEDAKE